MTREQRIERILDLLARPDENRERGRTNLSHLDDEGLSSMLEQLEQDSLVISKTVEQWLEPVSGAGLVALDESELEAMSDSSIEKLRGNKIFRSKLSEEEVDIESAPIAAHLPQISRNSLDTAFEGPTDRGAIAELKSMTFERCMALQSICVRHSNEQPALKDIVDQYAKTLREVDQERGMYRLHLDAQRMEYVLRSQGARIFTPEASQPFDAELAHALHSLLTAHVGFISFFPNVLHLSQELNRYSAQAAAFDYLRSSFRGTDESNFLSTQNELLSLSRELSKYKVLRETARTSRLAAISFSTISFSMLTTELIRVCLGLARAFLRTAKYLFSSLSRLG